jgi:hypothetical protein
MRYIFFSFWVVVLLTVGCTPIQPSTDLLTPAATVINTASVSSPLPTKSPEKTRGQATIIAPINLNSLASGEYLIGFRKISENEFAPVVFTTDGTQLGLLPSHEIGVLSPNLKYIENLPYVYGLYDNSKIFISNIGTCNNPSWSPDSTHIVAECSGQNPYADLYLISIVDQTSIEITECGSRDILCNNPSWSPNGKWIAYFLSVQASGMYANEGLHIMNTNCFSFPSTCVDEKNGTDIDPPYTWSPDSRYIAGRTMGGVKIFTIDNGNLKSFKTYPVDTEISKIAWSPSGKWIAIRAISGNYLLSPDTGVLATLNLDYFFYWIKIP